MRAWAAQGDVAEALQGLRAAPRAPRLRARGGARRRAASDARRAAAHGRALTADRRAAPTRGRPSRRRGALGGRDRTARSRRRRPTAPAGTTRPPAWSRPPGAHRPGPDRVRRARRGAGRPGGRVRRGRGRRLAARPADRRARDRQDAPGDPSSRERSASAAARSRSTAAATPSRRAVPAVRRGAAAPRSPTRRCSRCGSASPRTWPSSRACCPSSAGPPRRRPRGARCADEHAERYRLFEAVVGAAGRAVARAAGAARARRPALGRQADAADAAPGRALGRRRRRCSSSAPTARPSAARRCSTRSPTCGASTSSSGSRCAGLGEDDAAALMRSSASPGIVRRRSPRPCGRSRRGNPFFLEELLRHQAPSGEGAATRPGGSASVPEAVKDVIGRRLARLSQRAAHACWRSPAWPAASSPCRCSRRSATCRRTRWTARWRRPSTPA